MRPPEQERASTRLPSVAPLRTAPSPTTDSGSRTPRSTLAPVAPLSPPPQATPAPAPPPPRRPRLRPVRPLPETRPSRILDFDLETLAAGYADPAWVPDKITCISASWVGDDHVHVWITGQDGYWSRQERA